MLKNYNHSFSDECVICLCKKNRNNLTILSCNHSFHTICLHEWFKKDFLCPLCMKEDTYYIKLFQNVKKLKISVVL